jgi:hypothetical protein
MAQRQAIKMEQKNKSVLQRAAQAGQCAHTSMAVRCVLGTVGSVEYFLALLQNITARKETEEALVNARNALE